METCGSVQAVLEAEQQWKHYTGWFICCPKGTLLMSDSTLLCSCHAHIAL